MLEIRGAQIKQGDFALGAEMQMTPGAQIAVIGPSGAGKSTLLMGLAGFLEIAEGEILWNEQDITRARPNARPFAVLFQDNNLFPHMSIAQNVGLALRPSLRLSSDERARVETALHEVGLAGMGARKPAELSGGQQSRAALARVLLHDKPWLLLDEPFAALGPALKAEMLDLVSKLCKRSGAGLLMVSHDPGDARRICDRSILVAGQQAHAPVPTQELLDHPPSALRDYLGQ